VSLCKKLDVFPSEDIKLKKVDIANASAHTLLSYAVDCANNHKDYETSLEILNTLKPLVSGEILSKINEDLKIVKELFDESFVEPRVKKIIDKIDTLNKYIMDNIRDRACGRRPVDSLIQKGQEILSEIDVLSQLAVSPDSINKARIRLANVFDNFALGANNQFKDYGAAYLLLEFALSIPITNVNVRDKLSKDIYTIRNNYDIAIKNQKDHNTPYRGTSINDFGECIQRSLVFGIIGAIIGGVISQHPAGAIACGTLGAISGFLFRP
jgi:hypothetical protein